MKTKAILREATTKDMKAITVLIEKLIAYEVVLSGLSVIEDKGIILMEIIARALIDTDQAVWVVEKSGRLLGVFIAAKEESLTIDSRNPVCVFSHGYNQKTVLSFYEIHNKVKEWAKEKGCKAIQMTGLIENTNVQKLFEKLGYTKKTITYELEV